MGATVTDYASLGQAIQDFTHRPTLSAYTDYFIQQAQSRINTDIFAQNTGEGVRYMEAAYPPTAISSGTIPVPTDWLAPKDFQIQTGSGDAYGLEFKDPAWIYDNYPLRASTGIPAFIARDVVSGGQSFPTTLNNLTFTATANQTIFSLAAGPSGVPIMFVAVDGAMFVPTTDYTISGTTLTFTNGLLVGQKVYVQFLATGVIPAGSATWVFIFGPYPDSAYTIQGTYYQKAAVLSGTNTTNWMVTYAPNLILAACMVVASRFVKDAEQLQVWEAQYQQEIQQLIAQDKAERFSGGELTVQCDTACIW